MNSSVTAREMQNQDGSQLPNHTTILIALPLAQTAGAEVSTRQKTVEIC